MTSKEILSAVAIAITIGAFYPYIRDTVKGTVKPHVFTWVIWTLTTFVVFFAQLADGGGAGAWATGVSATITLFVAILAYINRTAFTITKEDWAFFLGALSSLPLWYFTADPLWAVIVLTIVDTLGFGPTVRKAYADPYSESAVFYGIFTTRNIIATVALENYTVTTVLFHVVMTLACASLAVMIVARRRSVAGVKG